MILHYTGYYWSFCWSSSVLYNSHVVLFCRRFRPLLSVMLVFLHFLRHHHHLFRCFSCENTRWLLLAVNVENSSEGCPKRRASVEHHETKKREKEDFLSEYPEERKLLGLREEEVDTTRLASLKLFKKLQRETWPRWWGMMMMPLQERWTERSRRHNKKETRFKNYLLCSPCFIEANTHEENKCVSVLLWLTSSPRTSSLFFPSS